MVEVDDVRTILGNLNDAVFLHDIDGNVLFVNDAACSRLGYTEDELLAMSLQDFDSPDSAAKIQERIEQLEAEGELVFESTHVRSDGEEIPVEVNATTLSYEGEPAVLSVARDITERKKRESALVEVNQRLTAVIEAAPDAIIVVDPAGRVQTWNPAAERIFGWSMSEVIGERNPIVPEPKRNEFEQYLDEVLAGESITQVETVRRTKAGELIDVSLSTAAIRDAEGAVIGIMGILQDISERKASERALERTNQQLLVLNRITRHDIRNDMNVVVGWSEELSSHVDEPGQEMLERIQETGRHVIELTRTVRDFVEALGTGAQPELKPVSVGEILDAEVTKRRSMYPHATFRVDDVPEIDVWANEMLSSVFRNVLNNAVQHNHEPDPVVDVGWTVSAETVQISIADNGPGVPDSEKARIFGGSEAPLHDSTGGVGLYLVEQLVDSYGGTVRIEDNEPTGSVFVIELDRVRGDE